MLLAHKSVKHVTTLPFSPAWGWSRISFFLYYSLWCIFILFKATAMNLQLSDIVFILLIFALFYGWWCNSNVREKAVATARDHCKKLNLQLLDESVAGDGWRPSWANHQPCIKRTYLFEFSSTGRVRYQGYVVFIGNRMLSIWLSPHDI